VTEIEPDAFGLSTRFDAEQPLVGNVAGICRQLALRLETWKRRRKKAAVTESMRKSGLALHFAIGMNHRAKFDNMTFKNPSAKLFDHDNKPAGRDRPASFPSLPALDPTAPTSSCIHQQRFRECVLVEDQLLRLWWSLYGGSHLQPARLAVVQPVFVLTAFDPNGEMGGDNVSMEGGTPGDDKLFRAAETRIDGTFEKSSWGPVRVSARTVYLEYVVWQKNCPYRIGQKCPPRDKIVFCRLDGTILSQPSCFGTN
jgi:hypothetical protein